MLRRAAPLALRLILLAALLLAPSPAFAQDDPDAIAAQIQTVRSAAPVYYESFRVDDGGWDTSATDDVIPYYTAGTLHLWVGAPETVGYSLSSWEAGDFFLEVDSYQVDGSLNNEFGVIFRYLDADNYYYFSVSSDGYYAFYRYLDGVWDPIIEWTASDAIATGEGSANWLGLFAVGNRLTFLINDYIVDTIYDDSFDYGGLGLTVGAIEEGGIDVAFDDLSLWDAAGPIQDEPTPTATLVPTATPVPTATRLPSPTPDAGPAEVVAIRRQPPTFASDFDTPEEHWPAASNDFATYTFQDGAFHVRILAVNTLGWSIDERTSQAAAADFYVEVELTDITGLIDSENGLVFRLRDANNFYLFGISGQATYSLFAKREGVWQPVVNWTASPALAAGRGATNRLAVLAQGASISLLANDSLLVTVTDATHSQGSIGLVAGSFAEPNVEIAFDHYALWSLDSVPAATPTRAPTPTALPPATGDIADELAELRLTDPTFTDEFQVDSGRWSPQPDEAVSLAVVDRELLLGVDGTLTLGWAALDTAVRDLYAEVDTRPVDPTTDAEFGLLFRLADADNFYQFTVDAAGQYNVLKVVDGEWTTLVDWTAAPVLTTGPEGVNRLGVLARGSQIVVTANDEVLTELEDTDPATGGVALAVGTYFDPAAEVAFDNFDLWDLSPDDAAD
jgi:hypothetical protein